MPKLVITEEMLDAIEAVKGTRDPQLTGIQIVERYYGESTKF